MLHTHTSQIRVDCPPHSDAAFPETLANAKLQQQQRHSFQHQQDQVGDQKGTWKKDMMIDCKCHDIKRYSHLFGYKLSIGEGQVLNKHPLIQSSLIQY